MLVLPHEPLIAQIPAPLLGGLSGLAGLVLFFILPVQGIDTSATKPLEMTLSVAVDAAVRATKGA